MGIKKTETTAYKAQSNGNVERFKGTLKGLLWAYCPQVNIVKKMSYIWVKNVVVFINQRAIFPVSEARFKLSLFLFFLIF